MQLKTFRIKTDIILFLFALSIAFFNSCSEEEKIISLGSDFINSDTRIVKIDTFSMELSTMMFDSLPSSGNDAALCGSFGDKILGKIWARSNFEFTYPSSFEILEQAIFDSAVLVLSYNSFYNGDTTSLFTLEVFQLENAIDPGENTYMYTNSQVNFKSSPIGVKSFYPKPTNDDSVSIRLKDIVGIELFEDLRFQTKYGYSEADILDYFHGIMIRTLNDNAEAVLGFKVSSLTPRIEIYYHNTSQADEIEYVEFRLSDTDLQFNQIQTERSGTSLASLNTQREDLNSILSGNKTFLQCGSGLMTKIGFPSMDQLILMKEEGVLLSAILEISPSDASIKTKNLPGTLDLYDTDKYNRFGTQLTDADGRTVEASITPDYQYNENMRYRFDITEFIKDEISDNYFDLEHALLLTFPAADVYTKTNSLQIETDSKSANAPKVIVYYLYY